MNVMGFRPTPLIKAVLERDQAQVSQLIAGGVNINAGDNQGKTPLMWAAETGQMDMTRTLLQAGASVNAGNVFGWTALIGAAYEGREGTVQILLENGADVNVRDNDGKTAMMRAKGDTVRHILANAEEKAYLAAEKRHEKAKVEMAKKEAEKEKQDNIQGERRASGLCVMCGERLGLMQRLLRRDRHPQCARFEE